MSVKIVQTLTGQTVGLTFPEKSSVNCPYCGKEYKTSDGLKSHIEKEHKRKPVEV